MLKSEGGKRCQRPPKAPAAAPDAQCQKTNLSRVQSAKAFLFSTIATATLSRSLARSPARSLGASHFFYTSLLGHLFPLCSCPSSFTLLLGILLPTRFLSFMLLFGISFLPPSFSIFYTSLEYFFFPFDLLIFCTSLWHFFLALLAFHLLMLASLGHFFPASWLSIFYSSLLLAISFHLPQLSIVYSLHVYTSLGNFFPTS